MLLIYLLFCNEHINLAFNLTFMTSEWWSSESYRRFSTWFARWATVWSTSRIVPELHKLKLFQYQTPFNLLLPSLSSLKPLVRSQKCGESRILGKRCTLETNHFVVGLRESEVYQYDVRQFYYSFWSFVAIMTSWDFSYDILSGLQKSWDILSRKSCCYGKTCIRTRAICFEWLSSYLWWKEALIYSYFTAIYLQDLWNWTAERWASLMEVGYSRHMHLIHRINSHFWCSSYLKSYENETV